MQKEMLQTLERYVCPFKIDRALKFMLVTVQLDFYKATKTF